MAKMGTRGMKRQLRKEAPEVEATIPGLQPGLNLVAIPAEVCVVAAQMFATPSFGVPIMREGFVTETGFSGSRILVGVGDCCGPRGDERV